MARLHVPRGRSPFRRPRHHRLARAYEGDVKAWVIGPIPGIVREYLIPGLADAIPTSDATTRDQDRITELLSRIFRLVEVGLPLAERIATRHIRQIGAQQADDIQDGLARVLDPSASGAAKRTLLRRAFEALRVDPIGSEPWLARETRNAVRENVALIRSIPSVYLSPLEGDVFRWVRQGLRHEEIARRIEAKYVSPHVDARAAVAGRRAKLIAVDQVGKFHGRLDELRQQHIGIEEYVWRTAQDERVRGPGGKYPRAHPSHRAREGKVFRWDSPPKETSSDGHPGTDFRCRCYADARIEEIRDFDALVTNVARRNLRRRSA